MFLGSPERWFAEENIVIDSSDRMSILVVSHPSVISENQAVYAALSREYKLTLVCPRTWPSEYSPTRTQASRHQDLAGEFCPRATLRSGKGQQHVYLMRPVKFISQRNLSLVFLEQEPFSLAALQWGRAALKSGIRFVVQMDENLDRHMDPVALRVRRWVLRNASMVIGRSPSACVLAKNWGFSGPTVVVPHAVPGWQQPPALSRPRAEGDEFTIGFAGRFLQEKGVLDLLQAAQSVTGHVRVLMVGDGPLRETLRSWTLPNGYVDVVTGVKHADMPGKFAEMDLLVLPSRTTPQWAEQFGRVLVEALACGTPVVGSSSGEIPWVVSETGGGVLFPEGDVNKLGEVLDHLSSNRSLLRHYADIGQASIERLFSDEACAVAMAAAFRDVVEA